MRKFVLNEVKILVGKSDVNNTELVRKYNGTGFTWFHLKDYPSSHLIIEKSIKDLTDEDKIVCSNMVKYYSKYKKEWTQKYWVDIICIDNVKIENKPGLVTISKSKKIKIKPVFNFNPEDYKMVEKDEK